MKCIGLLGGMSWESTLLYYQKLNEGVREHLGGLHSARILLHSVDFAEIADHQEKEEWGLAGNILAEAAYELQQAGAEAMVICTNLMHKVAPVIEERIEVPLLHIADAAGKEITARRLRRVGLLGTSYTMEEGFYRNRLLDNFGIDVVIPGETDRRLIHRVIFDELCQGQFTESARSSYLEIIDRLKRNGAEGIILGCTEIPLLVKPEDTDLPLFNTAELHAQMALEFVLGQIKPFQEIRNAVSELAK